MSLDHRSTIGNCEPNSSGRTQKLFPQVSWLNEGVRKALALLALATVAYSVAPAQAHAAQPATVVVSNTQQATVMFEWSPTGRSLDWRPLGEVAGGQAAAFQITVPDGQVFISLRANYDDRTMLSEAPDSDGAYPYEY